MVRTFQIKQGRDIPLKGSAEKKRVALPLPAAVAIHPSDFKGIRPYLCQKEGASVKAGTVLFHDKDFPELAVVAPVSGKILEIQRGPKRFIEAIIIAADKKQSFIKHKTYPQNNLKKLTRAQIVETLLKAGLWPVLRQRPFSIVASPDGQPKSIFVHAMNTEPLAGEIDFILEEKKEEFQAGLDILNRLTEKKVQLCFDAQAQGPSLRGAQGVELSAFTGPHPAGNVSTHIHYLDPIEKGDTVWYVEAQDVCRLGSFFLSGKYPADRTIAVTGEGAPERYYAQTVLGAPLAALLDDSDDNSLRYLSGSILMGQEVGPRGYVRFYDTQVTVLPEGGHRKWFGWLHWEHDHYSFSHTYAASFGPVKEVSLDTTLHGGLRAVVQNNIYDDLVPLDMLVYFLLRAVLAKEWEEAEALGLLECDPEDFALCSFACPSKTDVCGIIRQGLDELEREYR